jgi:hypothetical protein
MDTKHNSILLRQYAITHTDEGNAASLPGVGATPCLASQRLRG